MITIDSENLRLREIKKFDIPTLESLANDSKIKEYFFINYNKEEYFSNILLWNKPKNERDYWGFIIEEEKKAKGHIYLSLNQKKEAEFGFFIGEEFRGKNLSLKSTKLLIPFAFNELNLKKIIAKVQPKNNSSKKIIEKLNFAYQDVQNINNRLYEMYFLLKENF